MAHRILSTTVEQVWILSYPKYLNFVAFQVSYPHELSSTEYPEHSVKGFRLNFFYHGYFLRHQILHQAGLQVPQQH